MKRGFTIIESIVALTIIIAAVIGPFTLISRGILSSKSAKNRLIASNLAQEGIEMIRYFRDSNVLVGCLASDGVTPDWRGLVDTANNCTPLNNSAAGAHWETDASVNLSTAKASRLVSFTDGSGDRFLKFCTAAVGTDYGLYAYDCPNDPNNSGSTLNSSFKRRIKISDPGPESVCTDSAGCPPGASVTIPAADRMKIEVIILWQDGSLSRTLTQTEVLYNWR